MTSRRTLRIGGRSGPRVAHPVGEASDGSSEFSGALPNESGRLMNDKRNEPERRVRDTSDSDASDSKHREPHPCGSLRRPARRGGVFP